MHIALSVVEDDTFRDLLVYLNPTLATLLVKTHQSIRSWVIKEFKR